MRKRSKGRVRLVAVSIALAVLLVLVCASSLGIRKTVADYAEEQAVSLLFNAANQAVEEYLADNEITYKDIVNLSKNGSGDISALEIDTVKINQLKSAVSSRIASKTSNEERYTLAVPIGTLFGNEYTLGLGPQIKFRMQMASTVITDYESNFYSAGINQVLHQILIKVKISGSVIIPWYKTPFSLETSVIAAQTVLVGVTPDAYTNVIESYSYGQDGVVGDIFDYGATAK